MSINFHNKKNQTTYSTRNTDTTWKNIINKFIPIQEISKALDIGCGGGIYSKALVDIGVASVTAVDFSKVILEGAKNNCKNYHNISFMYGDAFHTGLENNSFDLVLERALIHHLKDLQKCFTEAYRVLKDEGIFLIQDRTPEDCLLKGTSSHIRGYFYELFPRLLEVETKRRHTSDLVIKSLKMVGFKSVEEVKLWEIREIHDTKDKLIQDIRLRNGRSILHELDDNELELLASYVKKLDLPDCNIVEKDRWTIWKAVK